MLTPRPLKLLVLTGCIALFGCTPAADPGPGGAGGSGSGGSSAGRGGSGSGGTTGGSTGGNTGGTTGGSSSTGGNGGSSSGGSGGSSSGGSGGSSTTGGSGGSAGSGGSSSGGSGGSSSGGSGGSSGDGASAEMPSTGTGGSGGSGPPPGGPYKVVLVYSPDHDASDPSLKGPDGMMDLLTSMKETHNVVPEMMLDNVAKASVLGDKALVIVGPNVRQGMIDPAIKNLAVPVMVSKDGGGTSALGLGTAGNTDANQDSIRIIATDHPITAGLQMGLIKVMTTNSAQRMVQFTALGPGAKKLATLANNANQFAVVTYDKGADMGRGLMAPAKRVGFFWHRPAGASDDGKKLFKSSVAWLIAAAP
jgi:hypothetical protein